MRTLKELSQAIGKWADKNFGTKRNGFLGICEELGEYAEATTGIDRVDALCDILIYALDHAYCEGIEVYPDPEARISGYGCNPTEVVQVITIVKGQLAQCELKNLQGIRKDPATFDKRRSDLLNQLILDTLECLADHHVDSLETLNNTFDNNVSKRNWKDDPENGGGYSHVVVEGDGASITISSIKCP